MTVFLEEDIKKKKAEAFEKAIDNLGRYKFMNFGYWAAIWIHMNQLSGMRDPNPFKPLVLLARTIGKGTNESQPESTTD